MQKNRILSFFGTGLLAGSLMLPASRAQACAVLDHGDPRVGSTVATAPAEITLYFSSGLILAKSTIQVTDMSGNVVSFGEIHTKDNDPTIVAIRVGALPPGKYKVKWNVLCECGNYTPGDYKFTVAPQG